LENQAEYTFGFAEKRISFEEFFNHKFLATTRSTLYSGSSVDPYDIVAPSTLLLLKEKCCSFSLAMPAAHICSYPYGFFFSRRRRRSAYLYIMKMKIGGKEPLQKTITKTSHPKTARHKTHSRLTHTQSLE